MRPHGPRSLNFLALVVAIPALASAADISWVNPSGGNWSNPANWSASALPGPGDNVFIILPGAYAVTQDVPVTVGSLTLGDGTGAPTLTNAGAWLSLSGPSAVRRNAVFTLGGGTLTGNGVLVIEGFLVWTGGEIAGSSGTTVADEGVMEITGPSVKLLRGTLSNAGQIRLAGAGALGLCAGTVENLAGGVFDLQNDQPIYLGAYCGPSVFRNAGLLRKVSGGGTNLFAAVPLANTGTVEAQSGWISFSDGSSFGTGTRFVGAGTNLLNQGGVWFDGTIVSSNAELATGAALWGTNTIQGTMRWTGGDLSGSARMTIASESQLEITGPAAKLIGGTLGNAGWVRLTEAGALGLCGGTVDNLAGGVFELQNDQPIYLGRYCGPSVFRNAGLLRKASGGGTNLFAAVPLANTGTVEAQSGWISFSGGSSFGAGTRFVGAGTNLLNQGGVWFDGTIMSSNAELATGATLLGTNTIQGTMRWTGGDLSGSARVTVASDSQLEITGPAAKLIGGTLGNAGQVRLTGAGALGLCGGTVDNLAGGVFDLQNDQPIYLGRYCGPSVFRNAGLLRKASGGGTNLFAAVPLANTGTVEAQSGWISFSSGSSFGTGTRFVGAGTNLLNQGGVWFDGTIVSSNAELATGALLLGVSTLQGTTRWTGGGIDHSARVTLGADTELEITGPADKVLAGTLSNAGLVRLTGAGALGLCGGTVDNLAGGVFDLQNDQPIYLGRYCGPSLFRNAGLLRKASGGGTNLFAGVPLANTGTVEAQSGWISVSGGSTFGTGTRFVGAGTNLLNQGGVSFDGTIVSSNAQLATGALLLGASTLQGAMQWTGGGIDASARVTVDRDGRLEITGPDVKQLAGLVSNAGLVRFTGSGALGLCAGTIENLAGGVFELQNDQPIFRWPYCGAPQFRNAGLLRKAGDGGTNLFAAVPLANTGTVEAQSGLIAFDGGFTQTAGRTRLSGGQVGSSIPLTFSGGILCGFGDIFGDVNNGAELNPGNPCAALTIHGSYVHRGTLNLELGGLEPGASHDRLNISGSATLRGALNVCLAPGYRPQPGDAFPVLTFGSRSGNFRGIRGLDLGGGKYLTPVYDPTQLALLTTQGPTNLHQMVFVPCSEGRYQLRFTGEPDALYTLEASVHLTNDWVALCTTNPTAGVIDLIDADAPAYPRRFYRAKAGR